MDWWESHQIQDCEAFTWTQFWERFRSHHVPASVIKTKKEFLALKQVNSDIILQLFLLSQDLTCSIFLKQEKLS